MKPVHNPFNFSISKLLLLVTMMSICISSWPNQLDEYQAKAGAIYNFTLFTHWPDQVGGTINLCIYGENPFGNILTSLSGKRVGKRQLEILDSDKNINWNKCQVIFVSTSAIHQIEKLQLELQAASTLIITDSQGALRKGSHINIDIINKRIKFGINIKAIKNTGLTVSSKLLNLATEVVK